MSHEVIEQTRYFLRSYTAKAQVKPSIQSPLHSQGFQIFKMAVNINDKVLDCAKKRCTSADIIFNHNEKNGRNDKKRRQTPLPRSSSYMQMFHAQVKDFVSKQVNTELEPTNPVILYSKAGCQPQAAHCDYEPDKNLKACGDANMPLALIVCLEPQTTLLTWPNSARLSLQSANELQDVSPIRCKQVSLNPGDILVFRGDFVHAGSGYQQDNVRIHYYLDSPLVPRTRNRTWLIQHHANDQMRRIIQPMVTKKPRLTPKFG